MLEDGRRTISGAGHIKQNASTGELEFELMTPSPVSTLGITEQNEMPGQLLDDTDFYSLSFTDLGGEEWLAKEVLPVFPLIPGRIIAGRVIQICQRSSWPNYPASNIALYFRGDFNIPCNTIKETSTTIEGREVESSSSRCVARFAFHDCHFFIETSENLLSVKIFNTQSCFPPYFEERVTEALEFILGRRLDWIALEKIETEQEACTIRGGPPTRPIRRIGPPLGYSSYDSTGDFWDLFKQYLAHIYRHRWLERPTLSRTVRFVLESARTYLDFQELALAISIEGILEDEYSGIVDVTDVMKKHLDEAITAILSLDIDGTIQKRIQGAIDAMKGIRPGDILLKLIESGTISKEHYDAWKEVRNRVAHARECDVDQERISLANRLLDLFYRLIFHAIDYTGHYTDYGSEGWPIKRLREPTVELGG
jgi:hypothetical protein